MMPLDFVSAPHTCEVEVSGMPGVPISVTRIMTEAHPQLLPDPRIFTNIIEVLHQRFVDFLQGSNALRNCEPV